MGSRIFMTFPGGFSRVLLETYRLFVFFCYSFFFYFIFFLRDWIAHLLLVACDGAGRRRRWSGSAPPASTQTMETPNVKHAPPPPPPPPPPTPTPTRQKNPKPKTKRKKQERKEKWYLWRPRTCRTSLTSHVGRHHATRGTVGVEAGGGQGVHGGVGG